MLSRVAERLYWMARYLERAENTARLVGVYDSLLLDLPRSTGLGWQDILPVFGSPARRATTGDSAPADDAPFLRFLLEDPDNPGSLLSSLSMARENARTTRDILPSEAWRSVNELTLHARARLPAAAVQQGRDQTLRDIVARCQHLSGLLAGTMSHGPAYQFIRLGHNLERADMTTRTIDMAATLLLGGRAEVKQYDNTLWMAVLRGLSAYQMYRQYVRRRIRAEDVIGYLLHDALFPRAIQHCLNEIGRALDELPVNQAPRARLVPVLERLDGMVMPEADPALLNRRLDELQRELAGLHEVIRQNWLAPGPGT
ncbi:MAG: alpha-E domain-containing protein [Chromatiales bacterium]|nr:alpha-E domain-containing protein [Chromatiales bacterium]